MPLLTAALPTVVRRLFPRGHALFTLSVVACLVGLEVVGRQATSDREDALAAAALLSTGLVVALRHRRAPHPWLGWLAGAGAGLVSRIEKIRSDCGIDLRGTPPLPRRTPRAIYYLAGSFAALTGIAVLLWAVFPNGWRDLGVRASYVLYLICLLAIWTGLIAGGLACIYLPMQTLRAPLRYVSGDEDARGAELAAWLGYFLFVCVLAWLAPPVIPIGLCAGVVLLAAVVFTLLGGDQAAIVWRPASGQHVVTVPLHRLLAAAVGLAALLLLALLLLACGGSLLGPLDPESPMVFTSSLGIWAAWTVPGAVIIGAIRGVAVWRTDPARRSPPTAWVTGFLPPDVRKQVTEIFRGWGWKARFAPAVRRRADVGIEIVPPALSEATEFDPKWPLKVSVADLEAGAVKDRLTRRDEIGLRRLGFRGLSKLFKKVASLRGSEGSGFLFAPHWWFIDGLTREEERGRGDDGEAGLRRVGPPFARVMPPRVRQHWHAVLRAVQVDLIYIEDGVRFKSLDRVLRAVLELFDVHAGRKRAEDLHFRGIPKVRVMIHDYAPGKSYETESDYPEPKFTDLTRLRILHVFKDRGESAERVEPPADFSWEPQPLTFG